MFFLGGDFYKWNPIMRIPERHADTEKYLCLCNKIQGYRRKEFSNNAEDIGDALHEIGSTNEIRTL